MSEQEKSIKQKQQLENYPKAQDWYDYKGYFPELHEGKPTTPQPLPEDVSKIFKQLNTTGLAGHRDPLCVDMNYTKNKYRFSVLPQEVRAPGTPQDIQERYKEWFENDWKQRSMIHKLGSILWYLPAHIYRSYFATADYRFYYNGLVSFIDRTRKKFFGF